MGFAFEEDEECHEILWMLCNYPEDNIFIRGVRQGVIEFLAACVKRKSN